MQRLRFYLRYLTLSFILIVAKPTEASGSPPVPASAASTASAQTYLQKIDCASVLQKVIKPSVVLVVDDVSSNPSEDHLKTVERGACIALRGAISQSPADSDYLSSLVFRVRDTVEGAAEQAGYKVARGEVGIGLGVLDLKLSDDDLSWILGHELGHAEQRKGWTLPRLRHCPARRSCPRSFTGEHPQGRHAACRNPGKPPERGSCADPVSAMTIRSGLACSFGSPAIQRRGREQGIPAARARSRWVAA